MTTLTDIDKQIAELQKQKAQLIEQEKADALKKAQAAVAELNALGFNYQLVEAGATPTATGSRRSGVKDQVLAAVQGAADGISKADLLEALGAKGDKAFTNSISTALSNLKNKDKSITQDSETKLYKAVSG